MGGAFHHLPISNELAIFGNEKTVSRPQQLAKLIEHGDLDYCRLDFVGHFPEFGRGSLVRWRRGGGLCHCRGRTGRCGWRSGLNLRWSLGWSRCAGDFGSRFSSAPRHRQNDDEDQSANEREMGLFHLRSATSMTTSASKFLNWRRRRVGTSKGSVR